MPEWKYRVDVSTVFHDEDLSLAAKAEVICAELMKVPVVDVELVEELRDAAEDDNIGWFDLTWNAVYDWADAERVWIATI